jgi:polysaccharide export outer membrane protein
MMACASATPDSQFLVPTPQQQPELKRGDILRVDVWRRPEFSGEFEISADGALVHPLYQEVTVAGLTLPAARQRLSEFLGTYLQGAQLVVEPLSSVTISGEVRQPNLYHVNWGTSIAQAIGRAGGPTRVARLDKVLLVRDGVEYELSLRQELSSYGNVDVLSGDQIFVDRQSEFNVWRDIVAPVATLAALTLTLIRISEKTGN